MVTRKIRGMKITCLIRDQTKPESERVYQTEVLLPEVIRRDTALLKKVRAVCPYEVLAIDKKEVVEHRRVMSEEDFMKYSYPAPDKENINKKGKGKKK